MCRVVRKRHTINHAELKSRVRATDRGRGDSRGKRAALPAFALEGSSDALSVGCLETLVESEEV